MELGVGVGAQGAQGAQVVVCDQYPGFGIGMPKMIMFGKYWPFWFFSF